MTDERLLRIIFAAIYSAAIIWLFSPRRRPLLRKRNKTDRETYSDGTIPPYLPIYLMVFALLAPLLGKDASRTFLSSLIVDIALCVGIYYMLLLPLLPWLRRHFSAAACAALWLIPNCLYFAVRTHTDIPRPLWVVTLPGQWGYVLLTLWLIGFLAVLGWKIVDHIRFRRLILKDANPAGAISLVYAWRRAVVEARLENTTLQLVTSPAVTAPLTIGLFRPFTRVVLPRDAQYTDEELALIFRHELIHVQRYHAWTKLLLVLCTAVCWFNPLMWIAMARSAEDLELSCDEAVLRDKDSATRRKYAHLLLNTAGSSRGFTTCLSASAEAMRYRLKNVMEPVCRSRGKMIRPGLVLLTAAATGGIKDEHITFAALLEMLHMASLIHDDVLDKADTRRDEPTPNALWGNELAVLLGDSLLAPAMVMARVTPAWAPSKIEDTKALLFPKKREKIKEIRTIVHQIQLITICISPLWCTICRVWGILSGYFQRIASKYSKSV